MNGTTQIRLWLATVAIAASGAAAQTATPEASGQRDRAEFTRLVGQRNELYAQLSMHGQDGTSYTAASETKWAQNQLDILEDRLSELATAYGWAVPAIPRGNPGLKLSPDPVMVAAYPGSTGTTTAKQRAEFNKLVLQRNKLYSQLTRLDTRASDMIKGGENAVVVHAQQVSAQDQLDLIELRLAILSTRYGMAVPPVPGRDPDTRGIIVAADEGGNRDVDRAFARGRERALSALRKDADRFLASLDFEPFLND